MPGVYDGDGVMLGSGVAVIGTAVTTVPTGGTVGPAVVGPAPTRPRGDAMIIVGAVGVG